MEAIPAWRLSRGDVRKNMGRLSLMDRNSVVKAAPVNK
jgi:hypothetical protein